MTSASTWNRALTTRPGPVAAVLLLGLLAAPAQSRGGDQEGCLGCHGLAGLAVRSGAGARVVAIDAGAYDLSAHGEIGCRDCHADIASIPHGEPREVSCGLPCHGQTAGGKPYSHERLYWEYAASSHGRPGAHRIACLVCHPAPARREDGGRDKSGEARLCAACHRGSERVLAWFSDRHALALAAGSPRAPSCADCHGSHGVHGVSAPESPVSPQRLAETCASGALAGGRKGGCHPGLKPPAAAGAGMSPLPVRRGARGGLGAALSLLAGCLLAGLVVRAGVGLARGR